MKNRLNVVEADSPVIDLLQNFAAFRRLSGLGDRIIGHQPAADFWLFFASRQLTVRN